MAEWGLADRFIKIGSILDRESPESAKHPDWDLGHANKAQLARLPTGAFPIMAAKKFGARTYPRFPEFPCTLAETAKLQDLGPTRYSSASSCLHDWGVSRMEDEPRFNIIGEARRMTEARANYPLNMSYQTVDRHFWTRNAAPSFEGDERWMSPRSKSVMSPMAFLKRRAGFHLSANLSKTDPKILRRRRKPTELLSTLRSINSPQAETPERPFVGFHDGLAQQCMTQGNISKCTVASSVSRDPERVIGNIVTEVERRNHMSPGDGFDESDQFWSRGFWGKASTWRRWQEQHTGDYRDTCPLREEEKRQKREVTDEPQTIQAKAHRLLHKEMKQGKDWAVDPRTRKSTEQYEADHKSRADRAKKRAQVGNIQDESDTGPKLDFGKPEKNPSNPDTPSQAKPFFASKSSKPGTPAVTSAEATITNVTL